VPASIASASALLRSRSVASSSKATSKCSTSAVLPRPVTMQNCSMPAARASSIAYWISGLSTTGSISLAVALVAGRKRVPSPATGNTALRNGLITTGLPFASDAPTVSLDWAECGGGCGSVHHTWRKARSRTRGASGVSAAAPQDVPCHVDARGEPIRPPAVGVCGAHQPVMGGANLLVGGARHQSQHLVSLLPRHGATARTRRWVAAAHTG